MIQRTYFKGNPENVTEDPIVAEGDPLGPDALDEAKADRDLRAEMKPARSCDYPRAQMEKSLVDVIILFLSKVESLNPPERRTIRRAIQTLTKKEELNNGQNYSQSAD